MQTNKQPQAQRPRYRFLLAAILLSTAGGCVGSTDEHGDTGSQEESDAGDVDIDAEDPDTSTTDTATTDVHDTPCEGPSNMALYEHAISDAVCRTNVGCNPPRGGVGASCADPQCLYCLDEECYIGGEPDPDCAEF